MILQAGHTLDSSEGADRSVEAFGRFTGRL
jgi:hypothetical protein